MFTWEESFLLYVEKSIISCYENDKKEMRASGLAEIAKVLQTMANYHKTGREETKDV